MSARNRYDAGVYPVTCPSGRIVSGPPTGNYWRISEAKFKELDADKRIWWGADGNNTPAVKRFLSEVASGRTPQTLWFYEEVGHTQDAKKTLLKYVQFQHTENVLNSVKPVELLQRVLQLAGQPNDSDIVLDFFSGSATTAHAVLKQNAEDGGNRRFIGVQIAEPLPKPEPGMASIFEMGQRRIRNVAKELRESDQTQQLDLGFRVLKIDTSNMADVYYSPDSLDKSNLDLFVDNIKPDRTAEDLLFQVMLDWGVDLTLPISREIIKVKNSETGKVKSEMEGGDASLFTAHSSDFKEYEIYKVDENSLVACFDAHGGIDEAFVKELATHKPLRVVFRDAGFKSDDVKINVEQIFKLLSPGTEVKCI